MSKRIIAAAAGLLLLGAVCRAQDDETASSQAPGQTSKGPEDWRFTPKQKFTFGNQGYEASDTTLELDMPLGLSVNAEAALFQSDIASQTATYSGGVGASWDRFSLKASYGIGTLANNQASRVFDLGGSIYSASKDFRTTFSADVNTTDDADFVRAAHFTQRVDITQLTPILALRQRFWNTRLSVELSDTQYFNQVLTDLPANRISRYPRLYGAYAGLSGLIRGFPSYSDKFGLYHDFDSVPLTLWGTYQGIHLETLQGGGGTVDNYVFGADYVLPKDITLTFSYDHIRQTTQTPDDLYNFAVTGRF